MFGSCLQSTLVRRYGIGSARQNLRIRRNLSNNANDATTAGPHTVSSAVKQGIVEPTASQLRTLALRSAIPMIGFGFMDNLVMLTAGEAIDLTIGVSFGLSTLTAAGFGQCLSDVAGITCGGLVDAIVSKLNLPNHGLSVAQLNLKRARLASSIGGCVGVVFGCLLGMTTLLFRDLEKADRLKKAKELRSIFGVVMDDGTKLVQADKATLWLLSDDGKELWSRGSGDLKDIQIAAKTGIAGACIEDGVVINVVDAYKDDRFSSYIDVATGYRTKSVVSVPVKDDEGSVIGAIQMVNKKNDDGNIGAFNNHDVRVIQTLATHVSLFIRTVNG